MSKYEPFYWLNKESTDFLSKGYLIKGQTPIERIRFIADTAENYLNIPGYADKFYDYMSRGWFSLASPVWSNYGTNKGLPISCFGSYPDDNMESILYTQAEVGMLSKLGGGTSGYFGALRPRGAPITNNGESSGAVHFLQLMDAVTNVVSQGSTRRGYFAGYLPADHPDILEFLKIGHDGNTIQGIYTGVAISDEFMSRVLNQEDTAVEVWLAIINSRKQVGFPYLVFTGNANNNKPECYSDKPIVASNLCSEIMLPSNPDETFVCVLSSMNLLHYDEWKDTDAVEVLTMFLDSVVTEAIDKLNIMQSKTKPEEWFLHRIQRFLENHRALGLGVLGLSSYYQSIGISFDSQKAAKLNYEMFKLIREKAENASIELGTRYGCVMGTNRRNTTLLAIAPTKSSSFILGQVSQGIEPLMSNYFINDTAKAKIVYKNKFLEELLESKGKNTSDVWQSILMNDGSVQHLDFLSDDEKAVFKTFAEIDPNFIIEQASIRQEFIDQGQSLNLLIGPSMKPKEIHQLYVKAWKLGIKSLYYQFGISSAQELSRSKLLQNECSACHA